MRQLTLEINGYLPTLIRMIYAYLFFQKKKLIAIKNLIIDNNMRNNLIDEYNFKLRQSNILLLITHLSKLYQN